jgi:t-SNARE complex subunit (syntaxin)
MSALVKDKQSTTGLQGPPGVRGDTGDPPKLQTQTLISLEEDAEKLAVLEERQNNVKVLEREIRDVNEIFRDLATLIHEQGTVVDSIEANIETGDLNLSSGLDELERARRKASQRRHRKFIIYGIISAIALLFLITLFSAIFA